MRAFRAAFRRFDDRYPWVRTYAGWNEVNHVSQPTFARPRLAVRYYRVLRGERRRRGFRVLAADFVSTEDGTGSVGAARWTTAWSSRPCGGSTRRSRRSTS